MIIHKSHKILTVAMLLLLFSVPFFIQRDQISQFEYSIRTVRTAVGLHGREPSADTPKPEPAPVAAKDWAKLTGTSLVGENLQK